MSLMGQRSVVVRYNPHTYGSIIMPMQCFDDNDYRFLVRYDSAYMVGDTLYVVLPDNHSVEKGRRGGEAVCLFHCLYLPKFRFSQRIYIRTEAPYIKLLFNGYCQSIFQKRNYSKRRIYDQIKYTENISTANAKV